MSHTRCKMIIVVVKLIFKSYGYSALFTLKKVSGAREEKTDYLSHYLDEAENGQTTKLHFSICVQTLFFS